MTTEKNKWIYWHQGDPLPSKLPDGCEGLEDGSFNKLDPRRPINNPNEWRNWYPAYRWPATEAEVKAHHWCLAHSISVPETHEVIRFGQEIETGEEYLTRFGSIETWRNFRDNLTFPHPILRKTEPDLEWVTPTDADVVKFGRLKCQVKDHDEEKWVDAELVLVDDMNSRDYCVLIGGRWRWRAKCRVDSRLLEQ